MEEGKSFSPLPMVSRMRVVVRITLFDLEMDHLCGVRERKAIDGVPGIELLQTGGWWFYSLSRNHLKRRRFFFFFGNIMNLDVYYIEFALYISDT